MRKSRKILLISLWTFTAIAALGLAAVAHLAHSSNDRPDLIPVTGIASETPLSTLQPLFDAPKFSLTDQDGKPFDSSQLAGKVWVADFIFTQCESLCPMMTANMATFQKMTPGSPVQMVSFSVDPDNDKPPVLKKYAAQHNADETRWHFLTGTRAQTWEISTGMKLAVGPDKGTQVMHSSHFLLVDGHGTVRGIYDADTAGFLNSLVADSNRLAQEKK